MPSSFGHSSSCDISYQIQCRMKYFKWLENRQLLGLADRRDCFL